MQLFPEKLRKIWNGWEVRGLILVSLILQIILIIFGSRRKFTASVKVRSLVWSAYMMADSVATIALGNLANSQADSRDDKRSEPGNVIQAFWAPFLLLHLGGPDTITAYALEDNELWIRHFLGLIVQVGVAFYVFVRSWSDNALTFIAFPMFITGIIKYGERTFVLRSSSEKHFKDSLLSIEIFDLPEERSNYLVQAYFLFKRSACLFANMIIDHHGQNDPSYSIVHNKSPEEAFKLVEAELGFLFDVLYTKATIVTSRIGIFLRCISFLSSFCALIVFSIIIDIPSYPKADISLTYLLLLAAVFLEVYALILFLLSNWTKIWLIKLNYKPIFLFNRCKRQQSISMAQYNLTRSCFKEESATRIGVLIRVLIRKMVNVEYWYLTRKDVHIDFQEVIFDHLKCKSNEIIEKFDDFIGKGRSLKELLDRRGDYVIEKMNFSDEFKWSTIEVDFDHSLLAWHIATNFCLAHDISDSHDHDTPDSNLERRISKCLSDYMLYLLIFCPSMLSKGISLEKQYKNTRNALKSILKPIAKSGGKMSTACDRLLENMKDERRTEDMSVLQVGWRLAERLRLIEDKWKMISKVWVEMLTYAANRCAWKEHGQQLRNGGELLTYVSFLMAHLGLSEQYEMKKTSISALPDREWQHLL